MHRCVLSLNISSLRASLELISFCRPTVYSSRSCCSSCIIYFQLSECGIRIRDAGLQEAMHANVTIIAGSGAMAQDNFGEKGVGPIAPPHSKIVGCQLVEK